jgi:hypothetical protein
MANAHTLTPTDLKALKACRTLIITSQLDASGCPDAATANVRILIGEGDATVETRFITQGHATYYGNWEEVGPAFSHGRCSAHVDHYPEQSTPVGTILDLLKTGDDIRFVWGIGAYTSPAMGPLKVNGDVLYLLVHRPGKNARTDKVMRFILDTRISTDPTTRMIQPKTF